MRAPQIYPDRCFKGAPSYAAEPFVWQDGVMTSPNDVVPWDAGVDVNEVAAINSAAQIAGSGSADGGSVAVLLTPVARLPADISGDCRVDASDLLILLFE